MSSQKPNGQASSNHGLTNLNANIAQLSSLLVQKPVEGDTDVAELLRTIETADGMAQGVESKLDSMLENLDNLLVSLESKADTDNMTGSNMASRDKGSN
jgi:hypothetical protein